MFCKLHSAIAAKQWSRFWETWRNILNARFVRIPTTNPKLYHVYTHFAVSVWRNMQEPVTEKESSVAHCAKRKSICPQKIASIICRPVFSTTVCRVSLLFDVVAMEVKWLVPNVEKPTSRCTIALTVDGLCAQTVTTRQKSTKIAAILK